jgi:hypothetical protein
MGRSRVRKRVSERTRGLTPRAQLARAVALLSSAAGSNPGCTSSSLEVLRLGSQKEATLHGLACRLVELAHGSSGNGGDGED